MLVRETHRGIAAFRAAWFVASGLFGLLGCGGSDAKDEGEFGPDFGAHFTHRDR